MPLQPMLHDLVVTLAAPTTVLSSPDGQVRPRGAEGCFHADLRVLSRAELAVGGVAPDGISSSPAGAGRDRFVGLARALGDPGPDPTLRVERERSVTPGGWDESLRLVSTASTPVVTDVTLDLAADLAATEQVKAGARPRPVPPTGGQTAGRISWQANGVRVDVSATGADVDGARVDVGADGARLTWSVELAPWGEVEIGWRVTVADAGSVVAAAPTGDTWATPQVRADDPRLAQLMRQSLEDLQGLRMVTADQPADVFAAAGAPWYLTLFGRDSLWTARMLLPLGTELAAGTLRTLAARQGRAVRPGTGEEPGKIPHELRRGPSQLAGGTGTLPPLYYGTVDATALWVVLLHDAWRWGMARGDVEALLPHLESALEWMSTYGDADGDGFLEYVDATGTGLANQGWKDSSDAVRFRSGTTAEAPIALCEVQGYAHEAAVAGAALLEAFGRPGADRWRAWATTLRESFRARFWVADGVGAYPAMALDADGRPVDAVTSNIGHLLGTGLLDAGESALVAARLASTSMDSGFGLRTMAEGSGGYGPLTYHCGSVWPHDTAIAVAGLARGGHHAEALALLEGLLAAAEGFGWRLPELYSGASRALHRRPVPYPAACRPQAWAAAAAVALLAAVLGVEPDVPAGRVAFRPLAPGPVGALEVSGLRLAGHDLSVAVDRSGRVCGATAPAGIDVVVPG